MNNLPQTQAWRDLAAHAQTDNDIVALNANEKERAARFTLAVDGVGFDFTRQRASRETLDLLLAFARRQKLQERLEAMFAGEKVNVTEGRAAWHSALRDPKGPAEVLETLALIRKKTESVRANPGITDIINIGIGGSDLGPRLVVDALLGGAHTMPRVHFVANVDSDDLAAALRGLDPAKTMVIAASKTFTTQETLANLAAARAWLKDDSRVLAVTANVPNARAHGIAPENILPFWDWVGGRFSLWSAVGLPVALACGFDAFAGLLRGAHACDMHVRQTPLERNAPILMALFGIWNRNFLDSPAHAVLPYSHRLGLLVSWLQQLEMESNGKHIDRDGNPCGYDTAPAVFGQPGTNAQHAFMQALHQGTMLVSADFIGVAEPAQPLVLANMRAQARALAEGGGQGHGACPGNRPSTTILLPRLDAYNLGILLAAYEHKTAAQGFLWNINAFDQFGVELGKKLAKELLA